MASNIMSNHVLNPNGVFDEIYIVSGVSVHVAVYCGFFLPAAMVPFLADLPILGKPFESVRKTKNETEVMIFLSCPNSQIAKGCEGPMPIRILIADDHALLRQGIKNVLELEQDFAIVAEAGDGEEAVRKAGEVVPDIALLDINMPRLNGLEVTKRIRANNPSVRVIILTIHDDESYVVEVVKAGAAGYLLKDIEPGMLIKAIRTVNDGESFIYPTLAKKLFGEITRLEEQRRHSATSLLQHGRDERLTLRELEVLQLIAKGLSNQEIAQKLFLSEKTVKNHLTNIFRKIDVADRTQAVLYAIKNKIVVLD